MLKTDGYRFPGSGSKPKSIRCPGSGGQANSSISRSLHQLALADAFAPPSNLDLRDPQTSTTTRINRHLYRTGVLYLHVPSVVRLWSGQLEPSYRRRTVSPRPQVNYEVGLPGSAQGYSSSLAGAYGFNSWELPELPQPASGVGGFSLDRGTSLALYDPDLVEFHHGLDVSLHSSHFQIGPQVDSGSSSLFEELLEKDLKLKGVRLLSTVDCGLWYTFHHFSL
ncbi:hypothetical protein B0H13DRAFT_1099460 [Mycena leptocephala]|nr:hypothetical protein B0H13DRAFT_1099460 [Mycena leptocephala]